MSLSSLSSSEIKKLLQLVKEKEDLQAKLAKVHRALDGFENGKATSGQPPTKLRGPRRGRRRMALTDGLLKLLQSAGKEGKTVKELAASLNAKPASVSVWFYTTGKKINGIRKVGVSRFALEAK